MKIQKKKIKNNGFTLIEILVAMAIFSTAIMVALAIFVSTQTLQQRTLSIQRGQSDARYALELMARKIRLGEIDYEYYTTTINSPVEVLALRDSNGLPVRFQKSGGVIQLCSSFSQTGTNTNESETCDSGAWVNITPTNITITRLDFYIWPSEDPYKLITEEAQGVVGSYKGGDNQERVTIVLESSITETTGGTYPTHFQTTISSRTYKR